MLGDSRQLIGRFDARIKGYDPRPVGSSPEYDPSLPEYLAIYSAAFNDYVRKELKYGENKEYKPEVDTFQWWSFAQTKVRGQDPGEAIPRRHRQMLCFHTDIET